MSNEYTAHTARVLQKKCAEIAELHFHVAEFRAEFDFAIDEIIERTSSLNEQLVSLAALLSANSEEDVQ